MKQATAVVVQGLGPIGARIFRAAADDPGLRVVGAVDVDPAKVGRPARDVAGGGPSGLTVRERLADVRVDGAVVLQATGSHLPSTADHVRQALEAGMHVASTCEELSYPFERHPELSRELDERARRAGLSVVGTGVNPGFLMDQLPVTLTGASHTIRSVTVRRVQDPSPRRQSFQDKVGLGLELAAYRERAASGAFGHIGLRESGLILAAGLGWTIDSWNETLAPVLPDGGGSVLGTLQRLSGATADGKRLELHFEASAAVEEGFDEIDVDGRPPLHLRFEGGVFGDDATAAAVLRAGRVLRVARRGLLTVLDLPLRAHGPNAADSTAPDDRGGPIRGRMGP